MYPSVFPGGLLLSGFPVKTVHALLSYLIVTHAPHITFPFKIIIIII